ncbi:25838_t:CDS:2, partial [Gigaspora margarita]
MSNEEHPKINKPVIEPINNNTKPNDDKIINLNINNIITSPNIIEPINHIDPNIIEPILLTQRVSSNITESINNNNIDSNIIEPINHIDPNIIEPTLSTQADNEKQEANSEEEEENNIELNGDLKCSDTIASEKTINKYSELLEVYLKNKNVKSFDYSKFNNLKIIG